MANELIAARRQKFGLGVILMVAASPIALIGGPAHAQSAPAPAEAATVEFAIRPQPLVDAMRAYSQATGIQAVYSTSAGSGATSPGVSGRMSAGEALSRLLAGTGLTYRFTGPQSVTLEEAPRASNGAIQLGPVRVAGQEQMSGGGVVLTPKTDLAATDRSRSYAARVATVADKGATSLRDIPQSVTVVTRQRMDDQNIVSLFDVATFATGVTPLSRIAADKDNAAYYIRGYLSQIEYDGVPVNSGTASSSQFDTAMYDRIEILRGPSGLLDGAGEPSGTINMVRKRPHDSFGWAASLMGGSWNNFHGDLDVTGSLNGAGTIRGRFVAAGQDRDFFVDKEHEKHGLLYGIVEFDLDENTTLTLSGAAEQSNQRGIDYGVLPYTDGTYVKAPRSTFYGVPWSGTKAPTREAYGALAHSFGNDWRLAASLDYRWSRYNSVYGYQYGTVNLDNSLDDYSLEHDLTTRKTITSDVNISGKIRLFGREHKVLLGANYSWLDTVSGGGFTDQPIPSIFDVDLPEIAIPLSYNSDTRTEQFGAYGKVNINVADPLKVILGGRITDYRSKVRSGVPSFGAFAKDPDVNGHLIPYAGILYDVTKNFTLYGSFTTIFAPQTEQKFGGGTLKPRTGQQFEAGVKSSFFDGALNASAALFTMTDRNRAFEDLDHPDFYIAAGKVRSRGAEIEVSGQPLTGWNVFAGYTYLETKFLEDDSAQGQLYDSQEPKHLFKLWTTYRIGDPDRPGFQIGGGIRAQSKTSRRGQDQPGYAVVDLQAGYRLNQQWSATVTVSNVFDKSYYVQIPSQIGGLYGDPRNVMFAIRKSF